MSNGHIAAVAFASAGLAMSGLLVRSRQIEEPSQWFSLTWPRSVDQHDVEAFFRHLAGDRRRHVVALEAVGHAGRVSYRLGIAERLAPSVLASLRSYVPGIDAELIDNDVVTAPTKAWHLTLSTRQRALRITDVEQIARAIVTTLSTANKRDTVVFQWLLGPRLAPASVETGQVAPAETWRESIRQLSHGSSEMNSDTRRSYKDKVGEPGFRASCRIGVASTTDGATEALAARLLAALRTAEAPGVQLDLKVEPASRIAMARVLKDWPTTVNVKELTALVAWPIGDKAFPGVTRVGATSLKASERISSNGRVIAEATYSGSERPLVLSPRDALQHLHVIGPTGVGKSTLLLNLISQDISAGRGVVVIDPKGDLVDEVLASVPENRIEDVVVLDPADEKRPVGINVMKGGGRSPELIADQVLAVFHGLYKDNWGPRTQDVLHASLLSLAGKPDTTLCALPVLLSNPNYRRQTVAGLSDAIALKPFWHWFETLSDGERQQAIAPVMNKLRAFLLRPRIRAVIGQVDPHFEISDVFTKRKIVLVSLAKGLLGPEAAALLGSLVISQLWQAALGRVRFASAKRSPVMVYVDEFQDYLHLPTDIADVLAQARGLGVGLTLAHQHLGQLPPTMRSAVLANARSRICFQLSSEDAKTVASTTTELTAADLQALPRYHAYVSLVADGQVTPFASARTMPPPERTSDPQVVRARSQATYGQDISDIETALANLVSGASGDDEKPAGRRRRA